MVGEINFSLLDPHQAARTAESWNLGGSFQQGQQNALALQQARQAQQINALSLQKAQQEMADDQAVRNTLAQSGNDLGAASDAMIKGGQYKQGLDLKSKLLEQQKSKMSQAIDALKLEKAHSDAVLANPTPENAVAHLQQLSQETGKDMSAQIAQVQTMTPDQIREMALRHSLEAKDLLPKIMTIAQGGSTRVAGFNPLTGKETGGQNYQKTASPDALLADARKKEELQGTAQGFTPEAISAAAARYNIDGTLPPMGMGKAGVAVRGMILNEAAKQQATSGISPEEQRQIQIGNTASSASLKKLQSQMNMVGAFERNFTANADMALNMTNQRDSTGVPLVNKWINSGKRAVTGDPTLSAYDAAIKATVNEYSKIISGSMGNTPMAESEIKKVEGLLNSAQTPQQVQSVINLMKQETQNRMTGFESERQQLLRSMSASGGRAKPGKNPQNQPNATPTVSNW